MALIAIAFALAGAWAYAEIAEADGTLDSNGRRVECIPKDHANPAGDCLWTPELTKAEVRVDFEYPYCEVKLDVEWNDDELPDGVSVRFAYLKHVQSDGTDDTLLYNSTGIRATHPDWDVTKLNRYGSGQGPARYKHDQTNEFRQLTEHVVRYLPQTTLGNIYVTGQLEYSGEFVKPKRVGNDVRSHREVAPHYIHTNRIPISHTFAGLFDEMTTCLEVAKREETRVSGARGAGGAEGGLAPVADAA